MQLTRLSEANTIETPVSSDRLIVSIFCPPAFALCLGLGAWLWVDVLGEQFSEQDVTILGYRFAWPLVILDPFIPASDSHYPNAQNIRMIMYVIAFLWIWANQSLLCYGSLWWRERRKPLGIQQTSHR